MNNSLSLRIFKAISDRGYTYEKCSEAFNTAFQEDIKKLNVRPLNKDFLYRIKIDNYSYASIRVAKLCEFLKINAYESQAEISLTKEAYMIDDLLKKRPDLRPQIESLIQNIVTITKGVSA